ncbi:MAG: gliding motility-associated C-terminal domain-containing protein, partial [Cytophagales bacterium]|nr:gliding motility-associated C-terminal domain-containing protein [Cytophagales bacterium]
SNYNYTWTLPGGTTRTGQQLTGLSENDLGRYEVRVVDATNGACSATASVTLGVDQLFPNLMVEAVAPLTTCDPERADGVARASVEGEIVGYTFDWFLGTDLVYSGTEFSGLLAQTYSVVATDIVNGCTTTEQVTIQEDILPIPNPTIEVISHVTSCDFDNGELSVSVDGNTSDYIFDWFNGQQATGTPSFTGEIYDSLAAGFYTVTATSRITGCVSEPVTEEIIEDKNFPEFEFVIKNASCGQEDGFAQLFITNDVAIDSVVWEGPTGDIVVGPNLANAPAGDYTVTVWSTEGCSVSESFTILPEINPYNGVSRNGDGRNDIFMIECIEDFPNNLVKIFNRSGTLVYEAEGYNNSSTVFDGVSNKGMRVIGTNLPDGTYYYVIDKRDGSAPFAGYLEVLK